MDAAPKERVPPVAPSLEQWARMSLAEREAFLDAVNAWHSDPAELMGEGRPHRVAKGQALDALTLHFSRTGRRIYVADDMTVLYPGEDSFVPDILAVLDVDQPADDPRLAWVVADEKKGLDFVLEVLHNGNRQKDLVRNVAWYARLGISEYFVYDRRHQRLHGWRLPPGGQAYAALKPRLGRLSSNVLGLDLAIAHDRLRFYVGAAELIGSDELIERLSGLLDSVEARAVAAEEAREAETRAREAETRAREAAEARTLNTLQSAVLAVLAARGLVPSEAMVARIQDCQDADRLVRWAALAATISRPEDLD